MAVKSSLPVASKRAAAKLSETQARIASLKAQLAAEQKVEATLIEELLPNVADADADDLTFANKEFQFVKYNAFDREILDQDKVRTLLEKLGKKVPVKTSHITTLRVLKTAL